jgi:nuclear pore complex protein Nup205
MSTEGVDDEMRQNFQIVVSEILQLDASHDNAKQYVNKCLDSMKDIKAWLQDLADKLNSASILGQGAVPEFAESIEFQRASLIQQHESLGAIVHYLVKGKYSAAENFDRILLVLKQADKYDNLLGK